MKIYRRFLLDKLCLRRSNSHKNAQTASPWKRKKRLTIQSMDFSPRCPKLGRKIRGSSANDVEKVVMKTRLALKRKVWRMSIVIYAIWWDIMIRWSVRSKMNSVINVDS